jgi:hypothetical protein
VCLKPSAAIHAAKTEIVWFGSHASLQKIANQDLTLAIGTEVVQPVPLVRDLGVLGCELNTRQLNAKVSAPVFSNCGDCVRFVGDLDRN